MDPPGQYISFGSLSCDTVISAIVIKILILANNFFVYCVLYDIILIQWCHENSILKPNQCLLLVVVKYKSRRFVDCEIFWVITSNDISNKV